MAIFLGGLSAIDYLSRNVERLDMTAAKPYAHPFKKSAPTEAEIRDALSGRLLGMEPPLDLLVRDAASRRNKTSACCHVWGEALPARAFVQLDPRGTLFASTAEFAIIQRCASLPAESLVEVAMLGCELCGSYHPSHDPLGRGFIDRPPLATPQSIRSMLGELRRHRGTAMLSRALRFILPGSASPRETALMLLLSIPCHLGGYGLPLPTLNPTLDVPDRFAHLVSQRIFKPDLYWASAHLAVEYDSDWAHAGPEEIARDSRRRTELGLLGVEVITVTNAQVKSARNLDRAARAIARRLGRRLRADNTPGWSLLNDRLREAVLFRKDGAPASQNAPSERLRSRQERIWQESDSDYLR